jgi:aryl-alcohol dehydrogenase-like predicted oxidoreductase
MKYVQLGRTELKVSRIAFGTWATGGWWWGQVDDQESIRAIQAALEDGINFFDTADVYGGGRAERVLAEALANHKDTIIATKGGVLFNEEKAIGTTNDPAYLKRACEASLKRLKRDVIDLYQIHWPAPDASIVDAITALQELQDEGKIRYFGLSNFGVEAMEVALDTARFETLQPPYNIFRRDIEDEILPFCEDNDISVLAYSPLASGLLTGKYLPDSKFDPADHRSANPMFQGEQFEKNLGIIEILKEYAERKECTITQLAISWTLAHPAVTCAICGAKRDMQVDEIVEAIDFPLSNKEVKEINALVESC